MIDELISRTNAVSLLVAIFTLAISALPIAFAGTSVALENAQDCYDAGYEDGRDSPIEGGANDVDNSLTIKEIRIIRLRIWMYVVQGNSVNDCE